MNALFAPTREDGRSVGQVIAEYVAGRIEDGSLKAGDIIPHSELASELDISPGDSSYYQAVASGTKLLEREHSRSLKAVRGAGYQLVEGMAQLDKGRDYHSRSRRSMKRGLSVVQTIDSATLAGATEKQLVLEIAKGMSNIVAILSMQAERLAHHDEQINMLKHARLEDRARVSVTEQEIRDLKARLQALEGGE